MDSRRWTTWLRSAFAGIALSLALVGIYGVTSWAVSQRTREIGIRMALGADRGQVLGMVILYGVRLFGIGLGVGLPAAFALRGVLSNLAFGVSTADPWIYGTQPYSNRSGSSRAILFHRGWNWNQPPYSLPTWLRAVRACS